MCGIAGLFSSRGISPDLLDAMADVLVHRGPDDRGIWYDADAGIGLAHRRLAIVDLSPGGAQPMVSADGRWVLSYNGEVYNHLDLRAQIEAAGKAPPGGWRGHSDTETLIEAFAAWGANATPQRATAWYGIRMAREINNEYMVPLTSVFPANRLGPGGDVAKGNCATCHQGAYKPLYGAAMAKYYPGMQAPVKPLDATFPSATPVTPAAQAPATKPEVKVGLGLEVGPAVMAVATKAEAPVK